MREIVHETELEVDEEQLDLAVSDIRKDYIGNTPLLRYLRTKRWEKYSLDKLAHGACIKLISLSKKGARQMIDNYVHIVSHKSS
jgi:hypothetical protein